MAERIGDHNIHEYLTAFADGDLDASAILTVLDYLAAHPEGLELMRNQQRLRLAAERAIRTDTPSMSQALRTRIEGMASDAAAAASPDATGAPAQSPRGRDCAGPSRWRVAGIAAAFLLAGIAAGRWVLAPAPTTEVIVAPPDESVVPATLVVHASRVHADCSRLTAELHAAGYPAEMGKVKEAVQNDLGGGAPFPDLSPAGFEFVGAGPCAAPLENTVHLLYQSADRSQHKAVSIYVQLNTGQFRLEADKLYFLSGPRSTFPMFAWRTDSVVYYLVADDLDTAEKSRGLIAGAPKPPAARG